MIMRSILTAIVLSIGLLSICSCHSLDLDGDGHSKNTVIGSGNIIGDIRQVGYFNGIKILGSFTVYIRKGTQELRIETDENIMPLIETWHEGDTLCIGTEQPYRSQHGIIVYASMETLRRFVIAGSGKITGHDFALSTDTLELKIAGSGSIHLNGVTARHVSTVIAGSGNIDLTGTADSHMVRVAGSGNLETFDFTVKTYNIEIAGSGDCRIHVTENLAVVIAGSGSIYYKGRPPLVTSTILGSGKLVSMD